MLVIGVENTLNIDYIHVRRPWLLIVKAPRSPSSTRHFHPFAVPSAFEITCPSPSNDAYPLSNLLSPSNSESLSGFLADTFVRPPVSVKLKYSLPGPGFRLRQVSLSSRVSWSQESELFEVWLKGGRAELTRGARGAPDPDRKSCLFYSSDSPPPYRGCSGQHELPRRLTRCVTEIEIKILRTKGSCAPGLSNLKILGAPVSLIDRKEVERRVAAAAQRSTRLETSPGAAAAIALASHSQEGIENESRAAGAGTPSSTSTPAHEPAAATSSVIVDALTFERARIPMVLPSGQIVDKSTLDQYNRREEAWGRAPNDPFTGKVFTRDRRPILLDQPPK